MSSLPPDPYKILGVSKDAQLSEIRSAHRKLVLKCHPDKVQDPKLKEEKQKEFQQVQQAYELLSNETERSRYDDKVRLEELRRDRGMASTSTSSPRTSKRSETKYHFDVREAEPRSTTFAGSPSSHNVYGHTPPSRSWDEDLHARKFDEKARYARKTASYEYEREKPSRKDDERRRRRDDEEWSREKDKAKEREREERLKEHREREALREKEREKEAAKKEKERRKDDRKEDKKRSDKDRRKETEDKHRRHKSPYIEVCPEDQEEVIYTTSSSKSEKKKPSSSRKYEEVPSAPQPRETSRPPPPTTDRERKNSETLESAIRYLSRSGGKPPTLNRAQTYHPEFSVRHIAPIAVPTPPPAAASAFAPPPMANPRDVPLDEDPTKRPSTKPRRMSHDTPRSSKEKSQKKAGSSREAIIVDASPTTATARVIPSFQKSPSMPIPIQSDSHRIPLSRSNTDNYSRPPPAPGLERASTWMPGSNLGRDRSRSRHARLYSDESSEDDRDRRHRRGRRTQSPEAMPTQSTKRYTVDSSRRVIPVQEYFPEESPRSSKKTSYPMPNSSARRTEPRPGYYAHGSYEDEVQSPFPNVKYATTFEAEDIKYADVPHSTFREEVFT
ncbi:DnaJ-domain-containing protein [Daldinia decipiens]|uniref:DnaJ-domain-containing protein n=1 Tax=Daldinia decipiens TaxID=326647 RepID=UPI0020C4BAA6|nr:DnaJ-domain-containing protein [Daldinia decipiens]KAI1654023.1 DnaJ-domain-containing protein [Daldinia decipiens]